MIIKTDKTTIEINSEDMINEGLDIAIETIKQLLLKRKNFEVKL